MVPKRQIAGKRKGFANSGMVHYRKGTEPA